MDAKKSAIYRISGNRFIVDRYQVDNPDDVKPILERTRKEHRGADHVVYAYKIGIARRYSDDGEPHGSAGIAIDQLLQYRSEDNILIVVTRYCGSKLGVGGLGRAYKAATMEVLG